MINLIPEFGKEIQFTVGKKETTVYKLNFPEYINSLFEISQYDETFEEFKDRMISVIKQRHEKNNKKVDNIKFLKVLHPHPALTFHVSSHRKFNEFYREKTLEELISDFGYDFDKKVSLNDYYTPKKYESICIMIESRTI